MSQEPIDSNGPGNPFEVDDIDMDADGSIYTRDPETGEFLTELTTGNADLADLALSIVTHPCDYCEGSKSESPSLTFSLDTKDDVHKYFSVCGNCFKEALDFIFAKKRRENFRVLGYEKPSVARTAMRKKAEIINPDDVYEGILEEIGK